MTNEALVLVGNPFPGIAHVTLNRPLKRNAMDGYLIHELIVALTKISQDKAIHAVILSGQGEHFCAGADIAWMQHMATRTPTENVRDAMQLATLLKLLYTFTKPIIGLIQGAVMGGGLGVIACCDIVIAAENSHFCFSEVKIGITPSVISPYVIPVIGERAARYYFLTAEKFDAKKASELGLVQHIVALDDLTKTGFSFAQTLLNNSVNALSEAKKLIQHVCNHDYSDELIQFTAQHLASMRASDDAQAGLKAFMEKR